jgi:hypothetical protein
MSSFDWKSFLQQWSQAILESMTDTDKEYLPQEVLNSNWLGYAGATDEQIARAETRLGVKLPPSYREFLKVSNGWRQTARQTDSFNHRLWSTEEIEHFAVRHPQWIKAFHDRLGTNGISLDEEFQELDDQWEPVTLSPVPLSDEDYLVYGDEQDPRKIRPDHLRTAIEISDIGVDSIYLLNPQVMTAEGEWEAWFFADYLQGGDRYRSFQEMMEAEYRNFLELREPTLETDFTPDQRISLDDENSDASSVEEEQDNVLVDITSLPWESLKRLTIEFQHHRQDDQPTYRTIANSSAPDTAHIWAGIAEDQLHHWLHHQLLEVKNIVLQSHPLMTDQRLEPVLESQETSAILAAASLAVADVIENDQGCGIDVQEPQAEDRSEEQAEELSLELNPEIVQLVIRQPSNATVRLMASSTDARKSKNVGRGSLSSQQPFSIEVAFHLAGPQIAGISLHRIFYRVQVFAQNRINHQWVELGQTAPNSLGNDQSTYVVNLSNQVLDTGMYRLQIITSLSGEALALSSFEVPLVNVA